MTDETYGDDAATGSGPLERITEMLAFLGTIDRRLLGAFSSLEEMRAAVVGLDALGARGEALVADIQRRVAELDKRIHEDLDELRDALLAKVADLDVKGLGPRLDRIEVAIYNIERATMGLNSTLEGSVRALPDFLENRIRSEREAAAVPTPEEQLGS